jgi:hypothetical protein
VRGISDGVSEAARKTAPINSPGPQKDCHTDRRRPGFRTASRGPELRPADDFKDMPGPSPTLAALS